MTPGASNPRSSGANTQGQYATINGLRMYYEVHGEGRPLVLLHGGYQVIEALEPLLSSLARHWQVIAPELEGHGRTADLDRPLTREQMAEDVAGLLDHLGVTEADVVGYSLGGMAAMRLAMRRPDLVRKLVLVSAPYSNDGYYPSTMAGWPDMSAEGFVGTPMEQVYMRAAPHPEHWPIFVEKVKHALMDFPGWSADDIRGITAPTLLILGDADLVRPEYAVEMFRLFGGARADGGMGGVPASQLAILPGVTHFSILSRLDLLLPIVTPFLDAPTSDTE
ncbi:MAG TPA: alpha/beta hydrolase [Ktedonobacterales bacterium]|nr:alpha/beta hydrolase [Ktedonobacterales bacterium]